MMCVTEETDLPLVDWDTLGQLEVRLCTHYSSVTVVKHFSRSC